MWVLIDTCKLQISGVVVARVRMNKLDTLAYKHAFEAIFKQAQKQDPNFGVGKTLKGIIADWSDVQLKGLQAAVGEKTADSVVKGCQVIHIIVQFLFYPKILLFSLCIGSLPALC